MPTLCLRLEGQTYEIAYRHRARPGDLVVFLHGLGASKECFDSAFTHPRFREVALLTFDFLGFGHSSKPEGCSYAMEDHAAMFDAVIERFPGRSLHLVAHSMGGAVGLLLSEKTWGSVKSFANLEGNLVEEDCFLSRKLSDAPFQTFETDLFPALKARCSVREDICVPLHMSSPIGFYRSAASLVKWSESGELLRRFLTLGCCRAYFFGERNAGIPVLTKLGDTERFEVKASGHFMMLDNPEALYAQLSDFQAR